MRNVLEGHFDTAKNKYAESVKFRHITQKSDEPVAQFSLRLRQQAAYCEYDEFLDRMLIEQLLHGLSDRNICDEIIAKKPTTFKDAYAIAHALESTRQTAEEIKTPIIETTHTLLSAAQQYKKSKNATHGKAKSHVQTQSNTSDPNTNTPQQNTRGENHRPLFCYGCGAQHIRAQCPFLNSECNFCKKTGHIAKVCRAKRRDNHTHQIQSDTNVTQDLDHTIRLDKVHEIHTTSERRMLNVKIDGVKLDMELDTGAALLAVIHCAK